MRNESPDHQPAPHSWVSALPPLGGAAPPHGTSTRSRVPIEVGKTTLLWPSRRPLEAMRRRRGFPFSTTDTTLRTRVLRGFDVELWTIFTTNKWAIIVSYERVSSIYRVSAPSHAQLSQNRNKVGGGEKIDHKIQAHSTPLKLGHTRCMTVQTYIHVSNNLQTLVYISAP